MIDLHTHFLPDWDDGPDDRAEADRMIALAEADGISKVVLTPHVFRATRHDGEEAGLEARMREFREQVSNGAIEFLPGAEVHVHPEIIARIKDLNLTINGSSFVFIEFPAEHLPSGATSLIYQMMLEGLIPIISHPERNRVFRRSPEILFELIRQGALSQITSLSLTGGFGPLVKKSAELFLRHRLGHVIASDAHNSTTRPPRLSEAVDAAARIVGRARAEGMVTTVPAAILANEEIPDAGEPIPPAKRNWLMSLARGVGLGVHSRP